MSTMGENEALRQVVGLGCYAVSGEGRGSVETAALGSCVGITFFDPAARVGGLLHAMLPGPPTAEDTDREPSMFVASGVSQVMGEMQRLGARLERITICAAGGAELIDDPAGYRIGVRNSEMLEQVLSERNLSLTSSSLGGKRPRSMRIHLEDGRVDISIGGQWAELWRPQAA